MTDAVAIAERVLAQLETKRQTSNERATALADERNALAYKAHVENEAKAVKRLSQINNELAVFASEASSIESAITEAQHHLEIARHDAATAHDRAQAAELRHFAKRLIELTDVMDACFEDFNSAAAELKSVVDGIHQRGCPGPTGQSFMVGGKLAFLTALMGTSFHTKELPHLAPHERRSFASLGQSWASMVEANAASRLGDNEQSEPTATEPEAA
jgi:hypothetical protein